MKKLLAIILSIAIVACGVIAASADGEAVTATLGTVKGAKAGDAIEITVTMSDVEFAYAIVTVDGITFDETVLQFDGFKKGTFDGLNEFGADAFSFVGTSVGEENENVGGVVSKLKFTVLKDIEEASEVTANVTAKIYTDSEIIENADAEVTVTAGGVDVADPVSSEEPSSEVPSSEVPSSETPSSETPSGASSKPAGKVPPTGDGSVVFFAAILCAAMAAAFVITKRVKN